MLRVAACSAAVGLMLAGQAVELAWRQRAGALIPLPSDQFAALSSAPVILGAVLTAGALHWGLWRRSPGPLLLAVLVDAGLRVVLTEAWLGGASEQGAEALPAAGVLWAGIVPTAAGFSAGWLAERGGRWGRTRGGAAGAVAAMGLLSALVLSGAADAPAGHAPDDAPPNLLLVTIDTWRHDHLSAHPDAVAPDLTPHLDRLARRGWQFTQARAHAPLTVPSHASLLSGQGPWEHGLLGNGARVAPETPWLPETLKRAGYSTAAVVSGAVLRGRRGFGRGFDRFHDDLVEPAAVHDLVAMRLSRLLRGQPTPKTFRAEAPRALSRATAWLDRTEGPWFLWVHLYDAHTPHSAKPVPGVDEGALDALPDPCAYRDHPAPPAHGLAVPGALRGPDRGARCRPTDRLADRVRSYRAEVRRADDAVGHLLHRLRQTGELARTAVIVTADHGESLTEHGMRIAHQHSAYEPVLRVPLIVAPPGSTEGRRVDTVVEHRDLPATALAMLGLTGRSGRSWLEGGRPRNAPVASVTSLPGLPVPGRGEDPGFPSVRVAVRDRGHALIWSRSLKTEWYDLAADPHQLVDLAPTAPLPEGFEAAARAVAAGVGAARRDEEVDDGELEALRALGYVD